MKIMPLLFKDFYKTDHRRQYPKGVTKVYNWNREFVIFSKEIPGDPKPENYCEYIKSGRSE